MTDVATAPEQEQAATEGAVRPLSLLAQETFGPNFHGDVKEAESEPTEATQEPTDPSSEGDETGAEVEEANADETAQEPEASEDNEDTVSSFSELVEAQGLDWDWVKSLKVSVNVDGQTAEPTFSELVKSYRTSESAEKIIEEAKAKAGELTGNLTTQIQTVETQATIAAKVVDAFRQQIDADAAKVNWTQLKEDDPAVYAVKKEEFRERHAALERIVSEGRDAYEASTGEQREKALEQRRQYLAEQQAAFLEKVPEWRDDAMANAERERLVKYLPTLGFESDEIANAMDHRLVVMARKAMLSTTRARPRLRLPKREWPRCRRR